VDQYPSQFPVHAGIQLRRMGSGICSSMNCSEKFLAKAESLLVIPQCCLGYLEIGCRREYSAASGGDNHVRDPTARLSWTTKPRANAAERLVHRNAACWVSFVFGEATIQLGLLLVGQRQDFGRRVRLVGDAVPDIANELKAVGHAQTTIVEDWICHA